MTACCSMTVLEVLLARRELLAGAARRAPSSAASAVRGGHGPAGDRRARSRNTTKKWRPASGTRRARPRGRPTDASVVRRAASPPCGPAALRPRAPDELREVRSEPVAHHLERLRVAVPGAGSRYAPVLPADLHDLHRVVHEHAAGTYRTEQVVERALHVLLPAGRGRPAPGCASAAPARPRRAGARGPRRGAV